jgi:hypothetical protein
MWIQNGGEAHTHQASSQQIDIPVQQASSIISISKHHFCVCHTAQLKQSLEQSTQLWSDAYHHCSCIVTPEAVL